MRVYSTTDMDLYFRQGGNSTLAKCEAVKSSKKELLGTLSTLAVALGSGER